MLKKMLLIGLTAGVLSGCSLWGGSDEIEPNPLVDFTAEKQFVVKWSVQVGDGPGKAYHQMTPAVTSERVFAADREGLVVAVDKATGKTLWKTDLDVELTSGTGAGANRVVVVALTGEVYCLNADTGEVAWTRTLKSEVVSEPQLNNQIVVLQLINGVIVALNGQTGQEAWRYESQSPRLTLRGTSSPLVALDVTLAGLDNGKFVALDNASGSVLWEQSVSVAEGRSELERMTDVDGRPLLFENVIYVPSYQGELVAINPFNAQTVWKKKVSSFRSLAAGFGNIYLSESNDHVQAFDARSAASVWSQNQLEYRRLTAPVVSGNSVIVGDREGYLHAMSQIDGHFVARYDANSGLTGDMKVSDDIVYALTDSGRLLALTLQ
jgi:outer membrane protein assembly factor BamB